MKKTILLLLALSCALLLSGAALADASWPESEHPYASSSNLSWTYQHPTAAAYLRVIFSAETETESRYDVITITDSQGNATEYSGTALSGKSLLLPGRSFTIGLTSDSSVNKYGFSISTLQGLTQAEYEEALNTVVGTCGENVIWTMDRRTGTMTISGTGPMDDYCGIADDGYYTLWDVPLWSWDPDVSVSESRSQIRHVIIEEGVTTIGGGALRDLNGLLDVQIPTSVTRIGEWAFDSDTALEEITIPASVTSIGDHAFGGCTALQNITVDASNPSFKSVDGVLFSRNGKKLLSYCPGRTDSSYTVPTGVQIIKPAAFFNTSSLTEVTLPNSLTEIGDKAFAFTGIPSITLPKNLKTLGGGVFAYTPLEEAGLPLTLESIGGWAFGNCPLTTGIRYEGTEAMWNEIQIADDNDDLLNAPREYGAAVYCAHPSLTFHPAVAHTCTQDGTIAHWTCDACGDAFLDAAGKERTLDITDPAAHHYVSEVTLEPNCAESGVRTYTCTVCSANTEGHSITETINPTRQHHFVDGYCDNLRRNGTVCGTQDRIAYGTSGAVTWTLDSSYTLHLQGAGRMSDPVVLTLYNHGVPYQSYVNLPWEGWRDEVEAVIVEEGVTYISNMAFSNMPNMEFLRLPASLASFGDSVFTNNTQLRDIYFAGTYSAWNAINGPVKNYINGRNITVHCSNATYGPTYAEGICGSNVTWRVANGTLTLSGTGAMTDYVKTDSSGEVTQFKTPPFWSWNPGLSVEESRRQIQYLVIEEGVTTVGGGAFRDMDGLRGVQIPSTVTKIGAWAFEGATHVISFSIPASVTSIGDRAFYACTRLQSIDVDSANPSFKSVDGVLFSRNGKKLLSYCPGRPAASYAVPAGVQIIMPSAFSYTSALTQVTFPESLTEIRNWAFGHTGLTSVAVPEGVTKLGYCAFANTSIETASLPLSLTCIEEWVFGDCPLNSVVYAGTEDQWDRIEVWNDNDDLLNALQMLPGAERPLVLPAQLTVIGEGAFVNGKFTNVTLGSKVTTIERWAFQSCRRLRSITIPASCVNIDDEAFEGCGDVLFICPQGSVAWQFAQDHGFRVQAG